MASTSHGQRNFEAFFCVEPVKANPDDIEYKSAAITWHYPPDVSAVVNELRDIPQFCFPDLETIRLESPEKSKAEHFTFTLTDKDGHRIYGICLRNLGNGEGQHYDVRRRPKYCLCIITRHPFFAMFRLILIQVHAMRLLGQKSEEYFLRSVYNHKLLNRRDMIVIPANPELCIYRPFRVNVQDGKSSHPVGPLAEILGIERFFLILSAALCERRIIFIANDVETLSGAVHAAATMLYPFHWQHILIPLLPSNLLSYAAAPVPYMIGLKRYLLPRLVKEALSDVIIVDVDTGECTVQGTVVVPDIVGESGNSRNLAREGKERMMAGVSKLFGGIGDSNAPVNQSQQGSAQGASTQNVRDLVACMLADFRLEWATKPSTGGLARFGRSAADSSKEK
jgi:hypothetical protein